MKVSFVVMHDSGRDAPSFSINIGDLVFTGTPAGVGELVVCDEIEAFIEDDSLLELEVK